MYQTFFTLICNYIVAILPNMRLIPIFYVKVPYQGKDYKEYQYKYVEIIKDDKKSLSFCVAYFHIIKIFHVL